VVFKKKGDKMVIEGVIIVCLVSRRCVW